MTSEMLNPSADLPPIQRDAARVLLIAPDDSVLLLRFLAREGAAFWLTPGGGLNPGETHEQAALRELWEETGYDHVTLGPWVWRRTTRYTSRGRRVEQHERYFVARAQPRSFDRAGHDDYEHRAILGYRWWRPDELAQSEDRFAPRHIATLLPPLLAGPWPRRPIDVPM